MKQATLVTWALVALSVASVERAEAQVSDADDSSAFVAISRSAVRDSAFTRAGRVLVDPRPMLIVDIGDASSVSIDVARSDSTRRRVLVREHIGAGDATWPKDCAGVMVPYSPSGAHRSCPHETITVVAMTRPVPARGDTTPNMRIVYGIAMASGREGASRLVLEYRLQAGDGPWRILSKRIVSFAE